MHANGPQGPRKKYSPVDNENNLGFIFNETGKVVCCLNDLKKHRQTICDIFFNCSENQKSTEQFYLKSNDMLLC